MLYVIENRNQDAKHLTTLLDTINPLILFTSPSAACLELLKEHAGRGPVQDYSALMELAAPFTRAADGPKVYNEAGLAHYNLIRQEGAAPHANESEDEVYFRVETWFKLWLPYWCETPTVPAVILVDPSVFEVLHRVIDSNDTGIFPLERGPYGSIVAYHCDGFMVKTVKQLQ